MHLPESRKAHEQPSHPVDLALERTDSLEEDIIHDLKVGGDAEDLRMLPDVVAPQSREADDDLTSQRTSVVEDLL